ncbi:hypothetical protein COCMIDRAFT_94635 [Bipolaris oryzae ATCC 44560]|uniref:Uncharacterized protein n=1 Tax=Bipolaris oryzae ATCC 44560 TaxID=930090 RepID=W6Z7L9_COCMI|nr:uncharacterized protein COCMIDRAFT_94635 [Bipolaris oryzae ATCC 44560]EUC45763.1 hypothetical protein COCMIDRAFT_94635 [Bipolaris oryzae ATCC 44560]
MDPSLPTAVDYDEEPDRIRQDLLSRLHWNVFGPLDEVAVRDGPTLTPLAHHAIKSESIALPPLSKVTIHIDVCQEKYAMDEHDDEDRYQPPSPLVIEKTDGTPISINDFVTLVHPFLNANEEEISKCEDEFHTLPTRLEDGTTFVGVDPDEFTSGDHGHFYRSGNMPANPRFFFDEARFNAADEDEFEIYIVLFVDGNLGVSFDEFWARRAAVTYVHRE